MWFGQGEMLPQCWLVVKNGPAHLKQEEKWKRELSELLQVDDRVDSCQAAGGLLALSAAVTGCVRKHLLFEVEEEGSLLERTAVWQGLTQRRE